MSQSPNEFIIHLPRPHAKQRSFVYSKAKRRIVRAGRRGGKTVGVSILAVETFLAGKRVLYAAPTAEQIARFWTTVTRSLDEPIKAGALRKNETEHLIEVAGTENRIRAKTAWNADTLRGDYADLLILDEWQLMDEDACLGYRIMKATAQIISNRLTHTRIILVGERGLSALTEY